MAVSDEDRRRWDARHAAAPRAPDGPSAFLLAVAPRIPRRGCALDVACGRGGDAVWLAQRGLTVDAVDVSTVALAAVRVLAAERLVARRVHTILADLDAGLPAGHGPYQCVVCVDFHAPALWPALRASLAPGGVLAIETTLTTQADLGLPGPSRRWLVAPGGLREAARGLTILHDDEGVFDGRHRARIVARREPLRENGRR